MRMTNDDVCLGRRLGVRPFAPVPRWLGVLLLAVAGLCATVDDGRAQRGAAREVVPLFRNSR